MKKHLLKNKTLKRIIHNSIKAKALLILLLSMAGLVGAQTRIWPMPGAEWTYCLYANGDAYAKEVWRVTSDSLIGNSVYNVIQPVDSLGHPVANSGKLLLTRCDSNKVYRYVNNKEYLFFPLDLNEGDVFTTFRSAGWGANGVLNYGNDSTCCSLKPLLVTEKKEVELGGLTLNEYTLKDTLFTSLYGYEDLGYWKMVDRIGPIDTYPLIDINEIGYYDNLCLYWFVCAPYVYLSAYRDDTFEYVWFVCNPTSVAENSLDEEIEVYPNPTIGLVTIIGNNLKQAEIINTPRPMRGHNQRRGRTNDGGHQQSTRWRLFRQHHRWRRAQVRAKGGEGIAILTPTLSNGDEYYGEFTVTN